MLVARGRGERWPGYTSSLTVLNQPEHERVVRFSHRELEVDLLLPPLGGHRLTWWTECCRIGGG